MRSKSGRHRVKHNNELAEALAKAAGIKSVEYFKFMAVQLAKRLDIDLPKE